MLKGSGGSVAGFLQFDLVPGLVQPGSDLAPSLQIVRFTMVPAWFHLVPTWFHLVPPGGAEEATLDGDCCGIWGVSAGHL